MRVDEDRRREIGRDGRRWTDRGCSCRYHTYGIPTGADRPSREIANGGRPSEAMHGALAPHTRCARGTGLAAGCRGTSRPSAPSAPGGPCRAGRSSGLREAASPFAPRAPRRSPRLRVSVTARRGDPRHSQARLCFALERNHLSHAGSADRRLMASCIMQDGRREMALCCESKAYFLTEKKHRSRVHSCLSGCLPASPALVRMGGASRRFPSLLPCSGHLPPCASHPIAGGVGAGWSRKKGSCAMHGARV